MPRVSSTGAAVLSDVLRFGANDNDDEVRDRIKLYSRPAEVFMCGTVTIVGRCSGSLVSRRSKGLMASSGSIWGCWGILTGATKSTDHSSRATFRVP